MDNEKLKVLQDEYGVVIPEESESKTLKEQFSIKGDHPESIDEAGFSLRTHNCLMHFISPPIGGDVSTVTINNLLNMTVGQLLKIRNLGTSGVVEVVMYLGQLSAKK